MMSNNKILTVSYGTFSCTLEGFDDSFGTMKAIAEYFRDLAADDRYFGAEPPQPDAEMLARIAQKEMSRKVQAREQDGKIVLSALENQSETVEPASIAAPVAAGLATAAQPAPDSVEAPVEIVTTPIDVDSPQLPDADLKIDDMVAEEAVETPDEEDLSVEEPQKTAVADLEEDVTPEIIPSAPDDVVADTAEQPTEDFDVDQDIPATTSAVADDDENDIVRGQPDADVEAFFADVAPVQDAQDDGFEDAPAAPVVAAPDTLDPNSIAAKLQRIRAVVAQHEEADDDDDFLEDEHAEAAPDKATDVVANARMDIEEALEADDVAEEEAVAFDNDADEIEAADDADDVSAILDRLAAETETDVADTQDTAENLVSEDDIDEADQDRADQDRSVEDTISNLFDENEETLDATPEPDPVQPRVTVKSVTRAPTKPAEAKNEANEAPQPRARVIKVKRADLEAAIEQGDLEEYGDEDAAAEAVTPRGLDDLAPARSRKTALSPEDEAELARELAELEADISSTSKTEKATTQQADPSDTSEPGQRPRSNLRRSLPSIDENVGTDVNRLLAETDHQMDEPESATRRDAFAHLRAAVAAKKADVAAGDTVDEGETDGAYRNDLAEAVRPRRPVARASRTERPAEERPAPLKLVAEQRVDADKPRPAGPVRPRRVAATVEAAAQVDDGESFAYFASEMGAATLPQLLEAAAAYMSFVEGREQFSRPQLMTKVRQAGGDGEFSREDGLRSFGQLLRAGKIEKIKGGRFTVSEDIGYRPDHRAAG